MFHGRLTAGRLYAGRLFHRDAAAAPETRPAGGGRAYPLRDATKRRRDEDELLLMVLL